MDVEQFRETKTKPTNLAVNSPVGYYRLHPPSPFSIAQSESRPLVLWSENVTVTFLTTTLSEFWPIWICFTCFKSEWIFQAFVVIVPPVIFK